MLVSGTSFGGRDDHGHRSAGFDRSAGLNRRSCTHWLEQHGVLKASHRLLSDNAHINCVLEAFRNGTCGVRDQGRRRDQVVVVVVEVVVRVLELVEVRHGAKRVRYRHMSRVSVLRIETLVRTTYAVASVMSRAAGWVLWQPQGLWSEPLVAPPHEPSRTRGSRPSPQKIGAARAQLMALCPHPASPRRRRRALVILLRGKRRQRRGSSEFEGALSARARPSAPPSYPSILRRVAASCTACIVAVAVVILHYLGTLSGVSEYLGTLSMEYLGTHWRYSSAGTRW
jgi:hypothetical protein